MGTCDLSSGDELVKEAKHPTQRKRDYCGSPLTGLFVPAFSVFLNMYHYQTHCVFYLLE